MKRYLPWVLASLGTLSTTASAQQINLNVCNLPGFKCFTQASVEESASIFRNAGQTEMTSQVATVQAAEKINFKLATPPEGNSYYASELCNAAGFHCIKVESGQTWSSLFPDEKQRDVVQRINRTYNYLWAGKTLAVPDKLSDADALDFAPFSRKIKVDERVIVVDQDKLAWGAYDEQGNLVKWGPIASGSTKCSDSSNSCLTLTGMFRVFNMENEKCVSDVFPIGKGGAKMPYCMFFHKGFALHGSDDIPGYRASHGCVRMFIEDAKWLNHNFVQRMNEQTNQKGTLVIVKPVRHL